MDSTVSYHVITHYKDWEFSDIHVYATRGEATQRWLDLAILYLDDDKVEIKLVRDKDVDALQAENPEMFR